jgi:hypothetical protein
MLRYSPSIQESGALADLEALRDWLISNWSYAKGKLTEKHFKRPVRNALLVLLSSLYLVIMFIFII